MKTILSMVLFSLLLTTACENPFAPGLTTRQAGSNLILTEQKSAEEVLTNFSYAYNFKDSLVYADLLDSSFLFISKNFATDPVTDLTWGRDVDIKTTVGLFHHFQTINLVWDGTLSSHYINDEHSLKEIRKTFKLTLDGGIEIPTISGEALFVFRKSLISPPDTSSIWRILRWEDRSTF